MKTPNPTKHYDFTDLGYGVQLECGTDTRFMQGDDAAYFLAQVDEIDRIWMKGNPNPDIFGQYADHLDLLINPYFS